MGKVEDERRGGYLDRVVREIGLTVRAGWAETFRLCLVLAVVAAGIVLVTGR